MNKIITVITGTSKGIGHFLAEQYLERGHIVIGCSRSNASITHKNYFHYSLDISQEDSVIAMFNDVQEKFGTIHNLINNAAIGEINHSLLTPASSVRKIMDTNFLGSFLFCRESARIMQTNKYGRIVNFSSVLVRDDQEGQVIYIASKAAVESMTRVLAKELAPFGITVNCIAPNAIETDLIKNIAKEKIEQTIRRQNVKRIGTFGDVFGVVEFFLAKQNNLVSGQIVVLGAS